MDKLAGIFLEAIEIVQEDNSLLVRSFPPTRGRDGVKRRGRGMNALQPIQSPLGELVEPRMELCRNGMVNYRRNFNVSRESFADTKLRKHDVKNILDIDVASDTPKRIRCTSEKLSAHFEWNRLHPRLLHGSPGSFQSATLGDGVALVMDPKGCRQQPMLAPSRPSAGHRARDPFVLR